MFNRRKFFYTFVVKEGASKKRNLKIPFTRVTGWIRPKEDHGKMRVEARPGALCPRGERALEGRAADGKSGCFWSPAPGAWAHTRVSVSSLSLCSEEALVRSHRPSPENVTRFPDHDVNAKRANLPERLKNKDERSSRPGGDRCPGRRPSQTRARGRNVEQGAVCASVASAVTSHEDRARSRR